MNDKEKIKSWTEECDKTHTHVIVMYDGQHNISHHKVAKSENIEDIMAIYRKEQMTFSEIYNLKMDIEKQLAEFKAYNK